MTQEIRRTSLASFIVIYGTPHQGEENHSRFKNLVSLLAEDINFAGLEEATLFDKSGLPFRPITTFPCRLAAAPIHA